MSSQTFTPLSQEKLIHVVGGSLAIKLPDITPIPMPAPLLPPEKKYDKPIQVELIVTPIG